MPTFFNRAEGYLLTTNLKVMYSTIAKQPGLEPFPWTGRQVLGMVFQRQPDHYMLVRSPFSRLESFFNNKLALVNLKLVERYGWQDCQRMFFPLLGLSGKEPVEAIKDGLLGIPWEQFLAWLPQIYRLDAHLHPQAWALVKRAGRLPVRLRLPYRRLLKMESDLPGMFDLLKLDASIHINPTLSPGNLSYTDRSRSMIRKLYREDFKRFGYD